MASFRLIALLLLRCLGALQYVVPPEYTINLDEDGATRWNKPCNDFKDEILYGWYWLSNVYAPIEVYYGALEIATKYWDNHIMEPYKSEIEGLSKCTGLSVYNLTAANLIYDISAFCTSIVAENSNGEIFHGRNLDYPIPPFRPLIIQANFIKNNKLVFKSTTYVGFVGILTGQVANGYTLSADQRFNGSLEENLEAMHENNLPVTWMMRNVLTNVTGYKSAVQQLSSTPIQAPIYIIVGGVNSGEGIVITRNQTGAVDLWDISQSEYKWYVVETNFDHWLPAGDQRRATAVQQMNSIGQNNINNITLRNNVELVYPVFNNKTQYNTQMSAKYPDMYNTIVVDYNASTTTPMPVNNL